MRYVIMGISSNWVTGFQLLHKYESTPRNLFCSFFKLFIYEDKDFRAFNLMR
jgi:hypothetical protein